MTEATFTDARAAMETAAQSTNGIRIKFPNKSLAVGFRHRCHKVRYNERIKWQKIYGENATHPWDNLCFNIWNVVEGKDMEVNPVWLYITLGEEIHIGFEFEMLNENNADNKGERLC